MKTDLSNFSWGFEIEGVFTENLINKLRESKDLSVEVKEDGSIYWNNIVDKIKDTDEDLCCEDETEISLGVFKSVDSLLKTIAMFKNGENYWKDEKCGLHLHIKPKEDEDEIKELFWDLSFIKKLEKYAFNELCDCVKKRKNNHFCESYKNLENMIEDYQSFEKYRFVRRHPSGTLEFRFFCPCKHKVENVEKFLNKTIELINKQCHKKKEVINLEFDINKLSKNYEININSDAVSKDYGYRVGSF